MTVGLPNIVYFKVAAIIISSGIKHICGYKNAIDKIHEYIACTSSKITKSNIASLGKHTIPKRTTTALKDDRSFVINEYEDDKCDKEKYFTALVM